MWQKEEIPLLSLMNLKTLYLIRKQSDVKWKDFKVKNIKLEHTKISKIPVSRFDDKRFSLDDGIYTLAYFHKDFKK